MAAAHHQLDRLDQARRRVAERHDRVADAGGDDDGGRAALVAAVDVRRLEAGQRDVPRPDERVDLAAVGVRREGQDRRDRGRGRRPRRPAGGSPGSDVGALQLGEQLVEFGVRRARRVAVGREADRDGPAVVVEAAHRTLCTISTPVAASAAVTASMLRPRST